MDYEFRRDITGQFKALFSMGHEAFGAWLIEEVGLRTSLLPELYQILSELEDKQRWDYSLAGQHYDLNLSRNAAEVRSATLSAEMGFDDASDELEGMSYYDDEAKANCGLDDFRDMLKAWERFVRESR